jgi:hypothetical protein
MVLGASELLDEVRAMVDGRLGQDVYGLADTVASMAVRYTKAQMLLALVAVVGELRAMKAVP